MLEKEQAEDSHSLASGLLKSHKTLSLFQAQPCTLSDGLNKTISVNYIIISK